MARSRNAHFPAAAVATLLLASSTVHAQDPDGEAQLRRLLGQSLASASLLVADDFATSGRFYGDDDALILRVRGFGGRHQFNGSGRWRPFLSGSATEVVIDSEPVLIGSVPDENRYEIRGLAIGGGVEYHFGTGLFLGVGLEVDYTWVENSYDYRSDATSGLAPVLDGLVVNWEAEVLTLQPTATVGWRRDWRLPGDDGEAPTRYRVGAVLAASWVGLRSDPVSVQNALQDQIVESEYLRLQAEITVPLPKKLAGEPLALTASWRESFLSSEISESLDTDTLSDYQLSLSAATPERVRKLLPIGRFGLRAGYSSADSFDGWTYGVTFAE